MLWQLLDQLLVVVVKLLGYIAAALVISIWLLVLIAILANIYKFVI